MNGPWQPERAQHMLGKEQMKDPCRAEHRLGGGAELAKAGVCPQALPEQGWREGVAGLVEAGGPAVSERSRSVPLERLDLR